MTLVAVFLGITTRDFEDAVLLISVFVTVMEVSK